MACDPTRLYCVGGGGYIPKERQTGAIFNPACLPTLCLLKKASTVSKKKRKNNNQPPPMYSLSLPPDGCFFETTPRREVKINNNLIV